MENKIFIISRIEGEYAYLKSESEPASDEIFIALALLPLGCDIGCRLSYENFEFSLI